MRPDPTCSKLSAPPSAGRNRPEATVDLDGLLDDYRPPRFNTSARMQMDSESERFVLEQQDALSAFAPTPTLQMRIAPPCF